MNLFSYFHMSSLPPFPATPDGWSVHRLDSVSSVTQLCLTLCDPMNLSTPVLPIHHKLMSIESVIPSNHLILCHPVFLLPSIFPKIRVFSNESTLIRWPKFWSFIFNISPSNEHPGVFGSLCSPRDSQKSSPTPQFKSINSSAPSPLYSPTLTSIYDYWKNHSLD